MERARSSTSWRWASCAAAFAAAISGCADPASLRGAASADGGTEMHLPQTQQDTAVRVATGTTIEAPERPAPSVGRSLTAPSGAGCRIDHPPGDCDRCPDRACLQVRLTLDLPPQDSSWAPFCDQGDVREEALIACLCAGGDRATCEPAAQDAALALSLVNHVFGGDVPAIGTRYRDSTGLRAVVDETMHAWLAHSVSAPTTIRCDTPDRDATEARYRERSQQVRITGACGG